MSKIVEPVVCLLGESVVGDPTQFVMERLAADCDIEWQFVTSEVSSSNLRAAIDGIRALNFDGIAFLTPTACNTDLPFESFAESARVSNRITAARRDGINWLAENLDGVALANMIDRQALENGHGKLMIYGDLQLANMIALAAPDLVPSMLYIAVEEVAAVPDESGESTTPGTNFGVPTIARTELSSQPQEVSVFVCSSSLSNLDVGILRTCKWCEDAQGIMMDASPENESTNQANLHSLKWADANCFQAAKLATLFQFWTGRAANKSLIRENLDEYSQW